MPDIARLRAFRAVVATGSVQAAASSLGYTPSAVSQQITALQRETGLTLFERSGRGITPTPAGLVLAAESDAVMVQLAHLDGVVSDLSAGRSGTLKVCAFPSAGEAWLPRVVQRLLADRPDVAVQVDLVDTTAVAALEGADVVLVTDDPEQGQTAAPGHRRLVLARELYQAVVDRDHPLATRDEVGMAELVQHPWVLEEQPGTSCERILRRAWARVGRTPRVVVNTSSHQSAIAFAAAGVGVFVGPHLAVARAASGSTARVLTITDPPVRLDVASVRLGSERNPATRRLLELLAESVADDPGLLAPG